MRMVTLGFYKFYLEPTEDGFLLTSLSKNFGFKSHFVRRRPFVYYGRVMEWYTIIFKDHLGYLWFTKVLAHNIPGEVEARRSYRKVRAAMMTYGQERDLSFQEGEVVVFTTPGTERKITGTIETYYSRYHMYGIRTREDKRLLVPPKDLSTASDERRRLFNRKPTHRILLNGEPVWEGRCTSSIDALKKSGREIKLIRPFAEKRQRIKPGREYTFEGHTVVIEEIQDGVAGEVISEVKVE